VTFALTARRSDKGRSKKRRKRKGKGKKSSKRKKQGESSPDARSAARMKSMVKGKHFLLLPLASQIASAAENWCATSAAAVQ